MKKVAYEIPKTKCCKADFVVKERAFSAFPKVTCSKCSKKADWPIVYTPSAEDDRKQPAPFEPGVFFV